MFPQLNLDNVIENVESETQRNQGVTFLYDFEKGDFVIRDGRLIEVTGKEATKVKLEKLIRTEKFKFKIYEKDGEEDEYGVGIKDLILGKKLPAFFRDSELEREISESVRNHIPEIERLENFETVQDSATLKIYFRVILRNGAFEQEVIF